MDCFDDQPRPFETGVSPRCCDILWTILLSVFWKTWATVQTGMRQFLNIFFSGTGFCAGKANGNYRDPDNCHGFIQCSNQIAYKQNCNPLWLKYNERKDQCDWPQNVQCGQGRFKTISFKRYFTAARLSCWKADSTSSLGDRCPVDMCYQNKSRYLVKSLCVIWWKIALSSIWKTWTTVHTGARQPSG